ncbi:MAG: DUF167 domain-containing protein [Planctomycetes bacterium]|nr:DUF167 domain-containing protein [Planctomycetota bacterium]
MQPRGGAFVLRLRVAPKARRDAITGVHGGALKVAVTEPPDKGKANEAVLRLIAKTLHLPPACIEVLAGHTSRDKQVSIRCGGTAEELATKLLSATTDKRD